MQKLPMTVIMACLIVAPAQARDPAIDLGPGAFVGAQIRLPLGSKASSKPRAGFAIAPTRSSVSSVGMVRTQIGEGFALDFMPGAKPTLTLAGVRADTALGLRPQGQIDPDNKLGLSSTGWIAIGVGVAAAVGGFLLFQHYTDCLDREDDNEC